MSDKKKPVALATEVKEDEACYLQTALEGVVDLQTIPTTLEEVDFTTYQDVEFLLPFVHTKVGKRELAGLPALKMIATRSTGYDHIDLKAAAERNITVSNVPGYGETAVAEYTFALLLALTRKLPQASKHGREGAIDVDALRGIDLYGKTLGVVGAGAIGLHVIRIAKGFGMNVVAFDVNQNRLLSEVLGFTYVSLDELFAQSDIVSLHAPALRSTYHIINRESLSKMKQGTILINTARGSLVDTQALLWAIDNKILAAVGLDTFEGEEFVEREEELLSSPAQEGMAEKLRMLVHNHILQRHPNVIITPHVAFNSQEALKRIMDTTIANIKAFLNGEKQNTVVAR